jgi:hypothetical protein
MRCHFLATVIAVVFAQHAPAQDMMSGPDKGGAVPALKVFDATGTFKDKEADYAADRKEKLTVYLFINAEKFDRPMNRFMKGLDAAIKKDFEDAYIVAVWLTGDAEKSKELLPKVQQSVQYEVTALTVFSGQEGPKGWDVNADCHITAVVAHKGKVAATFGYRSINETNVTKLKETLDKTIKGK